MDGGALPDLTVPALLELSGVTKAFDGVTALRGVDFSLLAGEIHGLVGENGAGKSTLMKIIAGVHSGEEGQMRLDGRPVQFGSPRDARTGGIGMVHQELAVVPGLSVAESMSILAPSRSGGLAWSTGGQCGAGPRSIWQISASTSIRAR